MNALSNIDSLRSFAPELVLGAGVIALLVVDLVQRGSSRMVAGGIATAASIGAALALVATAPGAGGAEGLFGGLIARDPYGDFWKMLFVVATVVVGVMATRARDAVDYDQNDRDAAEFYALTLTVCLGMFVMASATDLLLAYLSLETVSILSFALAGFKHRDRKSSEAALKYAIYGGVASGCMLYGLSLLYGLTGTTSLAGIAAAELTAHNPMTLTIGVALTLAGFGYKIAVVPFHQWCPDVYEGAPTPVTAFLSVGPKAAGFALLARFFVAAVPDEVFADADSLFGSHPWPMLLGAVAVMTMTYGNLVALVQTNVKRLLAYSSIAHAGYVMMGMLVTGDDGMTAMMFYLAVYLFMNLGAFGVVCAVAERGLGEDLRAFHRLGYRAPLVAACMAVFLVSLTGLPPTAGFAGKFLLFAALIREGGALLWAIALIGVLNSAISLFYYAKILKAMYFGYEGAPAGDDSPVAIHRPHTALIVAMTVPLILLGVYWSPLLDLAAAHLSFW
ncbi:MAG: NADH-quinone oxidoreductase subunit N [Deltaproteobacteria bacterium]|nr:MAG: NADH-quinone oxidoreductase subunit N [Deltaproteobacteria bacterium]